MAQHLLTDSGLLAMTRGAAIHHATGIRNWAVGRGEEEEKKRRRREEDDVWYNT